MTGSTHRRRADESTTTSAATTEPSQEFPTPQPGAARMAETQPQLSQYSVAQTLAVWAAAALPMGTLAWIITPWLSHRLTGRDPFLDALMICFNVGLLWMIALVLILVHREQGTLAWSRVRDALWLRAPQSPKTGRVGGRVWLWAVPFVVLSGIVNALPIDPVGPFPARSPQGDRE